MGSVCIRVVLGWLGRAIKRKGSPAETSATLAFWFNYALGAEPNPLGIGEEGVGASLSMVGLGSAALYERERRELLSPKVFFSKCMAWQDVYGVGGFLQCARHPSCRAVQPALCAHLAGAILQGTGKRVMSPGGERHTASLNWGK